MTFGEYIKEKRGIVSQRNFADVCGLSNAEISRLESGERKYPSVETLIKLSKGLNIPLMEIIEAYVEGNV